MASFEIVYLMGWAPDASQQKPLAPGSATMRLADALGTTEHSAGDKAAFPAKAEAEALEIVIALLGLTGIDRRRISVTPTARSIR